MSNLSKTILADIFLLIVITTITTLMCVLPFQREIGNYIVVSISWLYLSYRFVKYFKLLRKV